MEAELQQAFLPFTDKPKQSKTTLTLLSRENGTKDRPDNSFDWQQSRRSGVTPTFREALPLDCYFVEEFG